MPRLDKLTDLAELERLLQQQTAGESRNIDAEQMAEALKDRVKGQDHVVDELVRLIKREWAKEKRKRPIANLLFLGPTGTGKTELAKAIAEYLYGDDKAMLRFDCSEFTGPEAKTRLIGTPLGYVGSGQGGQLTRPVINNPKRLILFDEIEKAYTQVMDLFLQLMGDGRLTEQGSGEVADYTQSIIILTSNAEAEAIGKLQEEMSDYQEMVNAVKGHLSATGKFRPEIIGRIDRVYVFKPLGGMVMAEIVALKMSNLAKEYGLELSYVDPRLIFDAMNRGNKLKKFGIRELDREIGNMLGEHLVAAKQAGGKKIRLDIENDGVIGISPAD
ncbi:MAG TPA: AAA family ATPase [Bryobacteraceae bacterium]|nr:AAA family ATPase [Bryobacteraceae bacterium]